jgi:nitroimidazol reductase NimA-like FMN-containing flavoprotein (pyridoxamine 5'-phosphate oxidase superfamily)
LLGKNGNAAFFIDTDHELVQANVDCDWGMKYKSVAGRGLLSIVLDPDEKKKGLDSIMNHYSGRTEFAYDEKVFSFTHVLKLTVSEITGKKKI